jgi:hypothetical protein
MSMLEVETANSHDTFNFLGRAWDHLHARKPHWTIDEEGWRACHEAQWIVNEASKAVNSPHYEVKPYPEVR